MEFPALKQGGYVWVIIKIQPPITKAYSYLLPSTPRLLPYILPTYYLLPSYGTPTTIYQNLPTAPSIGNKYFYDSFSCRPNLYEDDSTSSYFYRYSTDVATCLSKKSGPTSTGVIMKRHPHTRISSYITITSPGCAQSHTQDTLCLLRISWLTRKKLQVPHWSNTRRKLSLQLELHIMNMSCAPKFVLISYSQLYLLLPLPLSIADLIIACLATCVKYVGICLISRLGMDR